MKDKGIETIMKRGMITLLIFLFQLSGCAAFQAASPYLGGEPTTLRVTWKNLIPYNHYTPFQPLTITNTQAVQQLYTFAQALPPPRFSVIRHCPVDLGLNYHLAFYQGHELVQEIVYATTGCPFVLIGVSDVRVPSKSFERLFVQTMGVSEAQLFPKLLWSCTPHSLCASPTPSP